MATAGVFQYFFWVLLQPFRGYPTYKQVVESAYNSSCIERIDKSQTDMKELGKYNLTHENIILHFFLFWLKAN